MTQIDALLCGVAAFMGIGVLAIVLQYWRSRSHIVYALSLVVCASLFAIALTHLLQDTTSPQLAVLPLGLPWLGAHFRLDSLSSCFLSIINFGGAVASLYALGSGEHEEAPGRVLPFYPAFLGGMNLVLLAADAFSFLFAWEFMSLSSWAMVMAHHRDRKNLRAGYIYLLMASFGTLILLLAFGLLAGPAGAYVFADMGQVPRADWLPGVVVMLALLGAGSKAGLVPLHVWLPLAHPAAPSHVSALMSGVMTKVAVYGFVRIVFDLAGAPAWWWSLPIIVVGAATAVLGVLFAMLQRDLKRLLAYSTVENIGIVFVALGLALAFKANGMQWAAALAFTAGILHALNHSLFKSLLFFGAGAVLNATGERNIEKLGGLIHRMPQTAFAFLGGSMAISALPPLNGFVSEWLLFQAILMSPELPQWGLKLVVPGAGAMLALAAALAAACFVRAFGITFQGRARSPAAAVARETDVFSRTAMLLLLAICLLAGILPGLLIDAAAPVARLVIGEAMPHQTSMRWLSIVPVAESRSSYNGLLVFAFIIISTLLAIEVIHRFASRAVRRVPAWDCGYPDPSPATQYTADSFAQPLRRVLGPSVLLVRERVRMPPPGDPRPARLILSWRDIVWKGIYEPLAGTIRTFAARLDMLQFLTIRRYLSLVFAALVGLLLVVAIWA
ncbi:MAG: hydrogenase 4 subunit B [Hyphomicrobiaceae bacterium]